MNRSMLFTPFALIACAQAATAATLDVVKTAACGCCVAWIDKMTAAGFVVHARNVTDITPIAKAAGVPDAMRSCHTAKIGGYVIEGHVPAADIRRLLATKPAGALGLSVPGMVVGSPGMEMTGRSDRYQVMLIRKDGNHKVWATHTGGAEKHIH